MRMENTYIRGLGGMGMGIPLRRVIKVTNMSNSKGSSLTLNILCTRNSEQCLRSLSACAEEHVAETTGTRISRILCIPTTLTLRRHPNVPNVHDAFKAKARLLGDLQLVCSQLTSRQYPGKRCIPPALGITTRRRVVYPRYNRHIRTPDTRRLTFGSRKTYPGYNNAKDIQAISLSSLMPSSSVDVSRNTITP